MTRQDDREFEEWAESPQGSYIDAKGAWQAALAHERHLKPVQADVSKNAMDDLIRRGDVLGALHDCRNILAMKNDVNAKTIGAVINSIPAISNDAVGEVIYADGDSELLNVLLFGKAIDDGLVNNGDFLFTAPPQSQTVKQALEAAAQVLDGWIKSSTDYGFSGDADNYKTIQAEIRALTQDEKES